MRANQRMTGFLEVPEGMLVLSLLTTSDMAAGETHSERRPGITERYALPTQVGFGIDLTNLRQMTASPLSEGPGPRLAQERVDQLL